VARYEVKKRSNEDFVKSKYRNKPYAEHCFGVWDRVNNHWIIGYDFRSKSACNAMCDILNLRESSLRPGRKRVNGKGSDFQ